MKHKLTISSLGKGDGTFEAHVDYLTGNSPEVIAIADLNRD